VATIPELLSWASAPDELISWASARADADVELLDASERALDALFESCPSAGWTPWLTAVATIPMELLVAAVGLAIESHAEGHPAITTALEEAYGAVTSEGSGEECLEAAERLDALASDPPRGFRADGAQIAKLASATALVLRAAEAVSAVMARAEAERMSRARAQTARFGGGLSAWVSPTSAPTVLARRALAVGDDEPATPELAFATAALGQALAVVATISGDAEAQRLFLDAL
jgi:hypothetical protein